MATDEDPEGLEIEALGTMIPSFDSLRVVEIGCGDGRLTRRYASKAKWVIAIDPDKAAVSELMSALPNVDARAIPLNELDLPPHSADVVMFAWSL